MSLKDFSSTSNLKKILTYVVGGGLSYLMKLGLSICFVEYFGWDESYSYLLAIIITVVTMFWYLARITFGVKGQLKDKMFSYLLTLISGYTLDWGLMTLLTSNGIDYKISLTISTISIAIIKYIVFNWVVFRNN